MSNTKMMDAIDSAYNLLAGSAYGNEFEDILIQCGANDDDSDSELGFFAGMSNEQIEEAFNRTKELLKKAINAMSPVEINQRFFGYASGGRELLDQFGLYLDEKGNVIEEALVNPIHFVEATDRKLISLVQSNIKGPLADRAGSSGFYSENGQRFMAIPVSTNSDAYDFDSYKQELRRVFPTAEIYSVMDDYEIVVDVTSFYTERKPVPEGMTIEKTLIKEEEFADNTEDFIINVKKHSKDEDWDPVDSAQTKEEAIDVAKMWLDDGYIAAEVVYMPEDDEDIAEVVWSSENKVDESLVMNEAEEEEQPKIRKYVSEFSEEEINEFVSKIDWNALNEHVSQLIGIKVNMVPGELRKGQYISVEDKTNYADKCGIMSPVFENVSVDCFNSALAVNKSNGKLFYWCTPHFSYTYKTYGSNGTEICRATFIGKEEGWVFDDSAVGGERMVKESLTENTTCNDLKPGDRISTWNDDEGTVLSIKDDKCEVEWDDGETSWIPCKDALEPLTENKCVIKESTDGKEKDIFVYFVPYVGRTVCEKAKAIKALKEELAHLENEDGPALAGRGFALYCEQAVDKEGEAWVGRDTSDQFVSRLKEYSERYE